MVSAGRTCSSNIRAKGLPPERFAIAREKDTTSVPMNTPPKTVIDDQFIYLSSWTDGGTDRHRALLPVLHIDGNAGDSDYALKMRLC